MSSPSSAERMLLERGKSAVRQVIDESVKEAVREAHAEEVASRETTPYGPTSESAEVSESEAVGATDGSSAGRRITATRVLLLFGTVVAFAYLRRRRNSSKTEG